jgi:hypothetical protein
MKTWNKTGIRYTAWCDIHRMSRCFAVLTLLFPTMVGYALSGLHSGTEDAMQMLFCNRIL